MKCKYETDPLYNLYCQLKLALVDKNITYDEAPDDIINAILGNNGCAFNDSVKSSTIELMSDTYLYLLYGAKNNEYNEVYEYINVFGSRYIIVFMDYINGSLKHYDNIKSNNMTIEEEAVYMMGNSTAFNSICNIVEFFMRLIYGQKPNSGSVQQKQLSIVPSIIAASIVNEINPLQENDCDGSILPYEVIMEYLNQPILNIILGLF